MIFLCISQPLPLSLLIQIQDTVSCQVQLRYILQVQMNKAARSLQCCSGHVVYMLVPASNLNNLKMCTSDKGFIILCWMSVCTGPLSNKRNLDSQCHMLYEPSCTAHQIITSRPLIPSPRVCESVIFESLKLHLSTARHRMLSRQQYGVLNLVYITKDDIS